MKKTLKFILNISPLKLYEIVRDKKVKGLVNNRSRIIINEYFSTHEIKKLQIGCGKNVLSDWLNTDLNSTQEIAYLDAGREFPFKNDSFDYIFSEHLFEHLDVSQQLNMTNESLRVLKKGGILRIATPSLQFLNSLYNFPENDDNKEYIRWAVNKTPGLQLVKSNIPDETYHKNYVINHFFKAWGHQMIHDIDSLKSLILSCGFLEVKKVEVGESEFKDLKCLEKHGELIPPKMNRIETMVIEAVK